MTFVLMLLLGGGVLLIVSAIECTSIIQTAADVWSGAVSGYTWQCGGGKPDLSGGTKNPCALATPADWCTPGSPCYDANKCAALRNGLAGPASSTPPPAARLVPWVRNGWSG